MIDLSIIILSYNTAKLTKECLLSIEKNKPRSFDYEAITVDNASTDGTVGAIQQFNNSTINKIKIISNKKNLGFSRANNQGVRIATGRYILFLNADTVVYPRTLETMIKFMDQHKSAGAATCRVELPTGGLDDSCHRGFPTPWRAFCHFSGLSKLFPRSRLFAGYSLGWMSLTETHEIDSCAGAFMIVKRQAGEEVNWWDEDYFWYGDDLDFCYRLKKKDWKIYFVPTVKILHYKGVSGGIKKISQHLTNATKETIIRATNARFQAMNIFYKKHYLNKYPRFITWLVMQGINLKRWLTLRSLT
ncbi:glycosyltransferase family 2 protein [Candidatus Daviesbacteria bacterium]|nr:glycosyltransferase family 2 protein [Candidatus Daviesbacteria bacterium]